MTIGYGRDNFHPRTIQRWDEIVESLGRCLVFSAIAEEKRPPWTALDVTSCFILTYHLVDFLEQFEGHPRKELQDFVRSHRALSLCRDISVNVKHARMSSSPYTAEGDKIELSPDSTRFKTGPGGTFHRVVIEWDGEFLDATAVAVQAYFDWYEWGMPLQDHTRPLWLPAEEVPSDRTGLSSYVLVTPKPEAWEHDRVDP